MHFVKLLPLEKSPINFLPPSPPHTLGADAIKGSPKIRLKAKGTSSNLNMKDGKILP